MSPKNKTPQKDPQKAPEKPVEKEVRKVAAPKTSPKKAVNLFMVVVLLMIAGGFYVYQKGYITKYYPLVKSKLAPASSLEESVIIPEKAPDDFVEKSVAEKSSGMPDENPSEPRALVSSPEASSEIAFLTERLQALEAKLESLSGAPVTGGEGAVQANKNTLKSFSSLQDLTSKIQQGLPFDAELQGVKNLLSPEDFETLQGFSRIGVPTLSYISLHFKKVARLLDQEEAFLNAKTIVEKGKALLGQLVSIEKTDTPSHIKDSKTRTYKKRLRQGDVAGVLKEIEALHSQDEDILLWITHGKAYEVANSILIKTKTAFFSS